MKVKGSKVLVTCDKCGKEYRYCTVQNCSHEVVVKEYGQDICMYCCKTCKHSEWVGTGRVCNWRG